MKKNITIIGAGLVGSLLSIYLSKRGYKVTIRERRADMRKQSIGAGRSINLALSERGLKALRAVGLDDVIMEECIPMTGRVIHLLNGETAYQPYGKDGQAIYSVSRGGLNKRLMDEAEQKSGVNILFDQRCTNIDHEQGIMEFEDQEIREIFKEKADLIIGADGAFSAVRHSMQFTDRFDYSQHYLEHGYKELCIPADENGLWQLDKNALHIWPRNSYMMIALPNLDGSFTCTMFLPFKGPVSFEAIKNEQDLLEFFKRDFADALPLMPALTHDFFHNPNSSLVTVKCFPWTYKDKIMMIGDASHAIVPFFGQGMNSGFEDCTVLDDIMDKKGDDWMGILAEFESIRKPNTDAIADMAYENFIEMRDKVADPRFLLRKKMEKMISEMYPGQYTPMYSMVSFSTVPYLQALESGRKQNDFFERVMGLDDIENKWNSPEVITLMDIWLKEANFFNI